MRRALAQTARPAGRLEPGVWVGRDGKYTSVFSVSIFSADGRAERGPDAAPPVPGLSAELAWDGSSLTPLGS